MDLLFLADLTAPQVAGLAFGCAILGVLLSASVMWFIQRTRRVEIEKENLARKQTAEAEAARIIAQAEAKARSEFI